MDKFNTKVNQERVKRDKIILRQEMNNHRGDTNKIPVLELCEKLGFKRRYLRALVREINLDKSSDYDKKLILTDTIEGGYWLDDPSDDPINAAIYYNSEHNRALKLLAKTAESKRKAEGLHGKAKFAQAMEKLSKQETAQGQLFG